MIARFNAAVLHNEYPDGAKVMTLDPLKGDKLTPRYEGPYTVVQRSSTGAYVLKDGTGEILERKTSLHLNLNLCLTTLKILRRTKSKLLWIIDPAE